MEANVEQKIVNGKEYTEITVEDDGFIVKLCNYGASIRDVIFHEKHMIATPKSFEEFITNGSYYGRTIGRTAGRIENGTFKLDGQKYQLPLNADNLHNMHGGLDGLAFKRWDYMIDEQIDKIIVSFAYFMTKLSDGFPGNLNVKVTYTIANNKIRIDYSGNTSEDTLLNLSNHTYFNISGDLKSNVLNDELYINASHYGKCNHTKIIENIISVNESMDFRKPKKICTNINDKSVYTYTNGYDHCFILDKVGLDKKAAILKNADNNTQLSIFTSYPCLVMYTCNYPDGLIVAGKDAEIAKNDAVCFECQFIPNGINMKIAKDQKSILKKKATYNESIMFQFEQID